MKIAYFNIAPAAIGANENFFLIFDEYDRRWYTMDEYKDQPVPEFGSSPVPMGELKQVSLIILYDL